jgi:ribosomal 30S subunit maturation factor RimM
MFYTTRTTVDPREVPGGRFEAFEEYAGYEVRDPVGQKLGSVENLFVNDGGKPEYIRVKIGLFGHKTVLIPITFVAIDKEQRTLVLQ